MKKILGIILVIIILLGAIYYIAFYEGAEYKLPQVDRHLIDSDIEIYTNKIGDAQALMVEAGEDIGLQYNILNHIGAQYYGLGRLDEAFNYYQQASVLIPEKATSFKEMSKVMNEAGYYDLALEYIDKSLAVDTFSTTAWEMKIGLMQYGLNSSFDEIVEMYDVAMSSVSNKHNLMTMYARYMEEKKEYQKALEAWEELFSVVENQPLYLEEVDRLKGIINNGN